MIKYFFSFLFLSFSLFAQNLPKLENWVTDLTNTLSKEQIFNLDRKLRDYQDSTSNQIVVLFIPSLDGNSIEELANEIFKFNRIGTKKNDNGVLILIAKEDRAIRIEVGYGLEAKLTDATSSSIIRNEIIPYFKEEKYYEGIIAGLNSIFQAIDGEYKGNPKEDNDLNIWTIIILLIFLMLIGYSSGRANRSFRIGRNIGGFGGGWGSGFKGGGFPGFGGGGFRGGGGLSGGGGASGRW